MYQLDIVSDIFVTSKKLLVSVSLYFYLGLISQYYQNMHITKENLKMGKELLEYLIGSQVSIVPSCGN